MLHVISQPMAYRTIRDTRLTMCVDVYGAVTGEQAVEEKGKLLAWQAEHRFWDDFVGGVSEPNSHFGSKACDGCCHCSIATGSRRQVLDGNTYCSRQPM